jgi:hypothetical protein
VKKIIVLSFALCSCFCLLAQTATNPRTAKSARQAEKRQRINAMAKLEEEGVLNFNKQSAFGLQLRSNGYGVFYEKAHMVTPRFANLYAIELTEIKHRKEEKTNIGGNNFFGGSYFYGKINNFYQLKLGYGQQYVFGQKGNKNGIAVTGIYQAGLSAGLLKPYYLKIDDGSRTGIRDIKYTSSDSTLFLDPPRGSYIVGSSGFLKGWDEVKVRPGAYLKTALRFDFGHYNESLQAIEIGLSVDAYAEKIQIMAYNPSGRFFYQGHVAIVFGRRK